LGGIELAYSRMSFGLSISREFRLENLVLCPETSRPSYNRIGSLETTREKRIGAVFRALMAHVAAYFKQADFRKMPLPLCGNSPNADFCPFLKSRHSASGLRCPLSAKAEIRRMAESEIARLSA
jgi:hypothetical protein